MKGPLNGDEWGMKKDGNCETLKAGQVYIWEVAQEPRAQIIFSPERFTASSAQLTVRTLNDY